MAEFKHSNPDYCDPPGAYREILAHPFDKINKSIEKRQEEFSEKAVEIWTLKV